MNWGGLTLYLSQFACGGYDKVVVVHRICDMVVIGDDYYFYTKGDANEKKDNYIIYPDMIIGKVNAKVPYIGLPTVWLKELFE